MDSKITLFIVSDEPIIELSIQLVACYSQSENICIECTPHSLHDEPFLSKVDVPVLFDPDLTNEYIVVKCNDFGTTNIEITKSIDVITCSVNNTVPDIFSKVDCTKFTLDSDIDLYIQFALTESDYLMDLNLTQVYEKISQFELKKYPHLAFNRFLLTFTDNGRVRDPFFYFDYTMKFIQYIRRSLLNNFKEFKILHHFIQVVLKYYRSLGLFGPHTAISYFLFEEIGMNFKSLPLDLPLPENSNQDFYYMNYSFIESTIPLTSYTALLWGYQVSCHDLFVAGIKNIRMNCLISRPLEIISIRLRESYGINESDSHKFAEFSHLFFTSLIGSSKLTTHFEKFSFPLSFINQLMLIKPLVKMPNNSAIKKSTNEDNNEEPVKFALPSAVLSNAPLEEFKKYDEHSGNLVYDFAQPHVASYRTNVLKYFRNSKVNFTSQIQIDPIITTFYGKTSVKFTKYTSRYNIAFLNGANVNKIQVSLNNPYFMIDTNGILYDKNQTTLIFCPRDVFSVQIPNTVIRIGQSAFENCTKLSEVVFEDSSQLHSIEPRAFYNCSRFKKINFLKCSKLKKIKNHAFEGISIKKLEFPQGGPIEIDGFAFSKCKKLNSIKFPPFIEVIGSYAFSNCETLSDIDFSKLTQLKAIMPYAFFNTAITKLEFHDSLTYLGNFAFAGCQKLENVTLSKDIGFLPDGLFQDDNKLKYIDCRGKFYCILRGAFSSVNNIVKINSSRSRFLYNEEEIADPNNIEYDEKRNIIKTVLDYQVNDDDEHECEIKYIKAHPEVIENISYCHPENDNVDDDFYETNYESIFLTVFSNAEVVKIPSKISEIGRFAFNQSNIRTVRFNQDSIVSRFNLYSFAHCQNLQKLNLKCTYITEIPDYCFISSSLKQIILPKEIHRIGRFSFACTKLKKINLAFTNVEIIDDYAFYEVELQTLTIPKTIKKLGSYFYNRKNDNNEEEEEEEEKEEEEVEEEEEEEEMDDYEKENKIIILKKPSQLEIIESFAFTKSEISEFEIPSSVKFIGAYAFSTTFLTSIKIPKNITSISEGMFCDCPNLENVEFEDISSISFIGEKAFQGTFLSSFTIPPNVIAIPDNCFYMCSSLANVDFSLSNKLVSIGKNAFFQSSFNNVKLPSSVVHIGESAFADIGNLEISPIVFPEMGSDKILQNIDTNKVFSPIKLLPGNQIEINELPTNLEPFIEENGFGKQSEFKGKTLKQFDTNTKMEINELIKINYCNTSGKYYLQALGIYLLEDNEESHAFLDENFGFTSPSISVILPYYEETSQKITHISVSCILKEKLISMIIEINDHTNIKVFDEFFKLLLKSPNTLFLNKKDILVMKQRYGFEAKPKYSQKYVYSTSMALIRKIMPNRGKISSKAELNYSAKYEFNQQEFIEATAITAITCAAFLSWFNTTNHTTIHFENIYGMDQRQKNIIKLFPLSQQELSETFFVFKYEENKTLTPYICQVLKSSENQSIWFDHPFFLQVEFEKRSSQKNNIVKSSNVIFYNILPIGTLRHVISKIHKNKEPFGYKKTMRINWILQIYRVLRIFQKNKSSLDEISTDSILVTDDFNLKFLFIQNSKIPEFTNEMFSLLACRLWSIIYEILTGIHIKEKQFNVNLYDPNQIKYDKPYFEKFINSVFEICKKQKDDNKFVESMDELLMNLPKKIPSFSQQDQEFDDSKTPFTLTQVK
ncbi:hypothetical protein TRFO_00893 [Tritrichomonas foetus]|uniref:Surface antigen BspA-like n=1 Tax=Tritrichomonas foetus TaxID=1144522 RepID=A0A1J4L287_9EUKA|nr:hypothetical protein TRFO_00893 [Tritrichomonas foetus]|eukprot:OHT17625.1 hypothetical protein TRFO_00893 [Tritrichomonas foetus]